MVSGLCFYSEFPKKDLLSDTSLNLDFLPKVIYTADMSQTYQPKTRKRLKTHGFLVRSKSANGRAVIKRRRQKGRAKLSV